MTTTRATRTIAHLVTDLASPDTRPCSSRVALLWGVLFTLCVTGYTFGQSNHHVYLLDAIRFGHPELLTRDWFVNNTLQYHYLFTLLTVGLAKLGILKLGFFVLYLALVVTMHAAWLSVVRSLGLGVRTYLFSLLIYHLSGGGLGLGVYQILQDGSFLPSNVAAVACLSALAFWLRDLSWWDGHRGQWDRHSCLSSGAAPSLPAGEMIRPSAGDRQESLSYWNTFAAAGCCAIAGLFHVNYAMACLAAWLGLSTLSLLQGRSLAPLRRWQTWLATLIATAPCAYTMLQAMHAADEKGASIPIADFFAVYVRLRHSHHHEPLAWPAALWLSFLWPIPLALYALWRMPRNRVVIGVAVVLGTVLALQLFAFVFAGVWYVSETLVKLSLFRFSPFAKLLSCVLAASLLVEQWRWSRKALPWATAAVGVGLLCVLLFRQDWPATVPLPSVGLLVGAGLLTIGLAVERSVRGRMSRAILAGGLLVALAAIVPLAARQQLGVAMPGEDDAEMAQVCVWAKANTPSDALFLVPPHDQSFVLAAQRAEVVSFKHVPQLSKELIEWKRRLDDVLDMNVATLPTPMPRTMQAMAERYTALSPEHLRAVAAEYGCDYVIAMARLGNTAGEPLYVSPAARYFVYRTAHLER